MWLSSVLTAHAMWAGAWVLGALVRGRRTAPVDAADAMLDVAITSIAGMALAGMFISALAATSLSSSPDRLVLFVAAGLAAAARGQRHWRDAIQRTVPAISPWTIALWAAAVALAALASSSGPVPTLFEILMLLAVYGAICTQRPGTESVGAAAILCFAFNGAFVAALGTDDALLIDGALFFAAVASAIVAQRAKSFEAMYSLAIFAAALSLRDVAFVTLLPLFLTLVTHVASSCAAPKRQLRLALGILVVAAAGAAIRAFLLPGGDAPAWTSPDNGGSAIAALGALPLSLVFGSEGKAVVTAIALLVPLPLAYLAWLLLGSWRGRRNESLTILALCVSYAYAFWLSTSHEGSAALLFFPALVAYIGRTFTAVALRWPAMRTITMLLMIGLAAPGPSGGAYVHDTFVDSIVRDRHEPLVRNIASPNEKNR